MKVQDIVKITENGTVITLTDSTECEVLQQVVVGVHTKCKSFWDEFGDKEVVSIITSAGDDDFELVTR